jgi:hypothetical protein
MSRDQAFTGGDGHGAEPPHLGHDFDILGWYGFLDEERAVGREHAAKLQTIRERVTAVTVDHDVHGFAHRVGGSHVGSPADENDGIRIVRTAIDRGITFMDNCWDYHGGKSEVVMAPGRGGEAADGRNELAEDSPIAGCPDVHGD